MNVFTFVVCIVAIGGATSIINQYLRTRTDREEKSGRYEEAVSELQALEDRIRVLERIVTENKYDLKREINKL
jgi:NADH:ubiquinone oxidoreductase subunit 3 (subunit A)